MDKNETVLYVEEEVKHLWQLESRPDLEKDCVDFIASQWGDDYDNDYLAYLVVKFLSNHCRDAVSSQDIEYMAQQQRGNDI